MVEILCGNNEFEMSLMNDDSVDSIVTDPPYGLKFMNRHWDYDVPTVEFWKEAYRVLKPGGHILVACGTRTQHRMAVNIEDAGFEIRDIIAWVYGSGFPKSLDISKAIDKTDANVERRNRNLYFTKWMRSTGITAAQINEATNSSMGSHYLTDKEQPAVATLAMFEKIKHLLPTPSPEIYQMMVDRTVESENYKNREIVDIRKDNGGRSIQFLAANNNEGHEYKITAPATDAAKQWDGWGTALKPAMELWTLARKPLEKRTVAENVLTYGTGGLNIDGCRVDADDAKGGEYTVKRFAPGASVVKDGNWKQDKEFTGQMKPGRFPANFIHDGSDEVLDLFPDAKGQQGRAKNDGKDSGNAVYGKMKNVSASPEPRGDEGSAARFFYCAKASKSDRGEGNTHETVKPTDLMRYLCRMITPPGGLILDPFAGSGTTGKAAALEGFDCILIEQQEKHIPTIERRVRLAEAQYDFSNY